MLKEFCVPLPTLTKREPLTLRFPLSLKDDLLKRTKTAAAGDRLQAAAGEVMSTLFGDAATRKVSTQQEAPVFEMEIHELSGIFTEIAFNPNRDIVEDR